MANLKVGGDGSNQYERAIPSNEGMQKISIARAAKLNGVSATAVERFRRVRTKAIPEVLTAVKAGEIPLTAEISQTLGVLLSRRKLGS
jgi:hypothetical protein